MTNCDFCRAPLFFDDNIRGRNGNRRPLNRDGTAHDCIERRDALEQKRIQQATPQQTEPPINEYNISDIYMILEELTRHVARIADAQERKL